MERVSTLAEKATAANCDEFIRLVEESTQVLANESGQVGNMQIADRMVKIKPVGEAIIVGDVHGDLESLVHVLRESRFVSKIHEDEDTFLIFLGDYGDRGDYSAEVYYVILKLKMLFPEDVVLMRGNHEGPEDLLPYPHDLPAQLCGRFGEGGSTAYARLRELFDQLYNVVLVKGRYLLVHGGAPSRASSLNDLAYAHKKHPDETFLEELLWSDPTEALRETCASPRGAGKLFGEHITDRILKVSGAKVVVRGHEPCGEGFKINHAGKVLTLFSRKGPPYYNTYGAYLQVDLTEKIENARQLVPYVHKF